MWFVRDDNTEVYETYNTKEEAKKAYDRIIMRYIAFKMDAYYAEDVSWGKVDSQTS